MKTVTFTDEEFAKVKAIMENALEHYEPYSSAAGGNSRICLYCFERCYDDDYMYEEPRIIHTPDCMGEAIGAKFNSVGSKQ